MADATELATRADIKTMLGIDDTSQDTLIDLVKANVEQFVKVRTGRDLLVPSSNYVEYYDGDGGNVLRLRQRPIVSVASIYSDPARIFSEATLIPASDLIGDAESLRLGFVELLTYRFLKGLKSTKITYSAGYSVVPTDLSMPVKLIACKQFNVLSKKMFAEKTQSPEHKAISSDVDAFLKNALATVHSYRR